MAVPAPEFEVFAFGNEDVAESGMSVVARTRQHDVITADFSREKYRVAIVGEKWVFKSPERYEILRFSNADRSAVEVLTPYYIISITDPDKTWIVSITRHERFAVRVSERYLFRLEVPVDRVLTSSDVYVWDTITLFAAEHADEAVI